MRIRRRYRNPGLYRRRREAGAPASVAAPYDCYDYPPWDVRERDHWSICDEAARSHQFLGIRIDEADAPDPAGYVRFRPVSRGIELGLGRHPDPCGPGMGRRQARATRSR